KTSFPGVGVAGEEHGVATNAGVIDPLRRRRAARAARRLDGDGAAGELERRPPAGMLDVLAAAVVARLAPHADLDEVLLVEALPRQNDGILEQLAERLRGVGGRGLQPSDLADERAAKARLVPDPERPLPRPRQELIRHRSLLDEPPLAELRLVLCVTGHEIAAARWIAQRVVVDRRYERDRIMTIDAGLSPDPADIEARSLLDHDAVAFVSPGLVEE